MLMLMLISFFIFIFKSITIVDSIVPVSVWEHTVERQLRSGGANICTYFLYQSIGFPVIMGQYPTSLEAIDLPANVALSWLHTLQTDVPYSMI